MSAWILIIMLAGGGGSAGAAPTSVSFRTEAACNAARDRVYAIFRQSSLNVAVAAICAEDPAPKKS